MMDYVAVSVDVSVCLAVSVSVSALHIFAGAGNGHRRAQSGGDTLHVAVEARAPTPHDATAAMQRLIERTGGIGDEACDEAEPKGGRRRSQSEGSVLHHGDEEHVCGLGSQDAGCTASGQTIQRTLVRLSQDQVEEAARVRLDATPKEERTLTDAPTLDDMLVSSTSANALLASLFVEEQQPHVVRPLAFDQVGPEGSEGCGQHRRTQSDGDHLYLLH